MRGHQVTSVLIPVMINPLGEDNMTPARHVDQVDTEVSHRR
ncbi:uncharacterized protein METZ01_LOCUS143461 [marine metagenome]|uniref:Uncharacterized protein n=1 Tax=marine metagenome TaxID=408172 RepID=A0A381ZPF1_9ZZZZ